MLVTTWEEAFTSSGCSSCLSGVSWWGRAVMGLKGAGSMCPPQPAELEGVGSPAFQLHAPPLWTSQSPALFH